MTRARAIEEALREVVASIDLNGYVAQRFAADLHARAALSLPADAPPDEYRRGWTACMVAAVKWTEQTDMGLRYERDSMFQHLSTMLALAPPAPSSAATKEEK